MKYKIKYYVKCANDSCESRLRLTYAQIKSAHPKKFCSKKCFIEARSGEKSYNWSSECKGNYNVLHKWLRRRIKKPKMCEVCKINPPYDLTNINHKYNKNIEDWVWKCRSCHKKYDYALKK